MVVLGKSSCIRVNWLYSGKVVSFGHGAFIRTNLDVLGQSGCILDKVVLFWLSCCIGEHWLYLAKSGCIGAKMVVFGQQLLYSVESGCIPEKVVVYGEMWLYLGKSVCN